MNLQRACRAAAAGLALALCTSIAPAAEIDLHAYWDNRCKQCHGDAGPFARRVLGVTDGRLVGRHHEDGLDTFLRQHYVADELVAPVTRMLLAQATTAPVYQAKCSGCHANAAAFARESLALRDGVLVGKRGGKPVGETLRTHGGLALEEVAPLLSTLTRVLGEVGPAR